MQVIVGGRHGGKTHKLVKWLKEDPNRVLICHSSAEAQRIVWDYKVDRNQVLSCSQWGKRRGSVPTGIAVDNIDLVLSYILGAQVDMVALTGEVKK